MSDDFDITLERKLGSKEDGRDDGVSDVRRIELITGVGRRRRWSTEDKARIVVDSLKPGVGVSEVARRNGLSPQQLFAWRRKARALSHEVGSATPTDRPTANPASQPRRGKGGQLPSPEVCNYNDAPAFAPVVISASARSSPPTPSQPPPLGSGTIEIAIVDAVVRVIGHVEAEALVAVLHAVRRAS